jgi:hypothetical protein
MRSSRLIKDKFCAIKLADKARGSGTRKYDPRLVYETIDRRRVVFFEDLTRKLAEKRVEQQ